MKSGPQSDHHIIHKRKARAKPPQLKEKKGRWVEPVYKFDQKKHRGGGQKTGTERQSFEGGPEGKKVMLGGGGGRKQAPGGRFTSKQMDQIPPTLF